MTSFGICSTPKLSKQVIQLSKAIQWVPVLEYSSRYFTCYPCFILLGKLSLEQTPLNVGAFW